MTNDPYADMANAAAQSVERSVGKQKELAASYQTFKVGDAVRARHVDACGAVVVWDGTIKDTDPSGYTKVQIGGIVLWFEPGRVTKKES